MTKVLLDASDLEAYVPHRGLNLIPDQVDLDQERDYAESQTQVAVDDPRGRQLLSRRGAADERVWYEPFVCELLALTGVPLLKAILAEGEVAVFSALSRLQIDGEAPQAERVTGTAQVIRHRGDFSQYRASFSVGERQVLSAEFISGTASFSDIAATSPVPLAGPVGEAPQADFGWKAACLRFIDGVRACDTEAGRLTATYSYPADHPLIPGHFPAAAIMMGVSQLAAIADAGIEAASRCGLQGSVRIDGTVSKSDGSELAEVRDLVLALSPVPRISSMKRIAFRAPAVPGDGLLIEVTVASC